MEAFDGGRHRRQTLHLMAGLQHPVTPDGRYFVVRGRLWRMTDPHLDPERKLDLVRDLMRARRAVVGCDQVGDAPVGG